MLKPLIIGAPFGNYSYFHTPHSTPTLGTYTRHDRGGWLWRLWRIAWTLRYNRASGGWVNKLGLPNPGIESLLDKHLTANGLFHNQPIELPDQILSLAITRTGAAGLDELRMLLAFARRFKPFAFEYNVSCPNIGGHGNHDAKFLDQQAGILAGWEMPAGTRLIVKVPPVDYEQVFWAFGEFVDYFHCCNTLPCRGGGMSGPILKPLVLQCLARAKAIVRDTPLIAGGGVRTPEDAMTYWRAGASHVSIASLLINPLNRHLVQELDQWSAEMILARSIPEDGVDQTFDGQYQGSGDGEAGGI